MQPISMEWPQMVAAILVYIVFEIYKEVRKKQAAAGLATEVKEAALRVADKVVVAADKVAGQVDVNTKVAKKVDANTAEAVDIAKRVEAQTEEIGKTTKITHVLVNERFGMSLNVAVDLARALVASSDTPENRKKLEKVLADKRTHDAQQAEADQLPQVKP